MTDSLKNLRTQLEREQAKSQALYQLSRGLNRAEDEVALLDVLGQPAIQAEADMAILFYIDLADDDQPEWLETVAGWYRDQSFAPAISLGKRLYLPDYEMAQLWLTSPCEPLLITDIQTDQRADDVTRQFFIDQQIRAMAIIPLTNAGRWVGVLTFGWLVVHPFSQLEVELYQALIGLAAPAVETRRLIDNLEQTITLRTAELTKANEQLHHSKTLLVEFLHQITEQPTDQFETTQDIIQQQQLVSLIRQAKREWETTIDAMSDWVSLIDLDGRILRTNRASETFMKRPLKTVLGQSCDDFMTKFGQSSALHPLATMCQTQQRESIDLYLPTAGQWVMITVEPVYDDTGQCISAVHIVRDITPRKQAEAELETYQQQLERLVQERTAKLEMTNERLKQEIEERQHVEEAYQVLVENSLQGLAILQEGRIVFINHRFLEIIGHSEAELYAMSIQEINAMTVHPDDQAMLLQRYRDRQAGKTQSPRYECRILRPDGTIRWLEHFATTINYRGQPAVQSTVVDITDRKEVEIALQESEAKYRTLFETINEGIIASGPAGTIITVNPATVRMFGYDRPEEMIGLPAAQLYAEVENRDCTLKQLKGQSYTHNIERWMRRKDGTPFYIRSNGVLQQDEAGNIIGATAFFVDITEQKQAQEKLQYQANLLENVSEAIFSTDSEHRILSWNKAAERIYGWTAEEVMGQYIEDVLQTDYPNRSLAELHNQLLTTGFLKSEVIQYRRNGQPIWINGSVSLLTDESGEVTGAVAVNQDITERKEMELALRQAHVDLERRVTERTAELAMANQTLQLKINALKEAESLLRYQANLLNQVSEAIISTDENFHIISWNRAAEKIYGWSAAEALYQSVAKLTQLQAATAQSEAMRHQFMADGFWEGEYQQRHKDGRLLDIHSSTSMITDEAGNFSGAVAVNRDITLYKQAEKSLQESELKYRSLIENMSEGVVLNELIYDADGQVVDWVIREVNPAYETLMDLPRQMVIDQPASMVYDSHVVSMYLEALTSVATTGKPLTLEVYSPWTASYFLASIFSVGPGQVAVAFTDITNRKANEERLNYQAKLLENVSDAIISTDTEFKIVSWNQAAEKIYGWTAAEAIGQSTRDILDSVEAPYKNEAIMRQFFEQGYLESEVNQWRKDGTPVFIRSVVTMLRDEAGRFSGVVGVNRDITAYKEAERENADLLERLVYKREQLRALAAQVAETQEVERKRLARELHDQVGQNLTALSFNLDFIRRQLTSTSNEPLILYLDDSLDLVKQTTKTIRHVMADLRPPVLDDYGLAAALEWYSHQLSNRVDFTIIVDNEPFDPRLSPVIENALFRITQEALTNVAKHARASRVQVTVSETNRIVRLEIADDGCGFDVSHKLSLSESLDIRCRFSGGEHSWGLITMSERAEAIGGHCMVESIPGQGSRVIVEVPLADNVGLFR